MDGVREAGEFIRLAAHAINGREDIIKKMMAAMIADGHIQICGAWQEASAIPKLFAEMLGLTHDVVELSAASRPEDLVGQSVFDFESDRNVYSIAPVTARLLTVRGLHTAKAAVRGHLYELMEVGSTVVSGTKVFTPEFFEVMSINTDMDGQDTVSALIADHFMATFSIDEMGAGAGRTGNMAWVRRTAGAGIDRNIKKRLSVIMGIVHMDRSLVDYVSEFAAESRRHPAIRKGLGRRAMDDIIAMGRAMAVLNDRIYVTPADINEVIPCVCAHRIIMTPSAAAGGMEVCALLEEMARAVFPYTIKEG